MPRLIADKDARLRYVALGGALLLLLAFHSRAAAWRGDFWIYVAAVDEIAARPLAPANPLFGNGYAFAFFSPYTMALGLFARLTHLGAYEVLVVQGVVNVLALLAALHAFNVTWLRRPAASFYALLFVLFLWGRDPWIFSSFFHLRSLTSVLTYPSTFAAAAALAGLAAFGGTARTRPRAASALMVPLGAVLWIVHPVNALFLSLGLFVWALSLPRWLETLALVGLAVAASVALALAWPMFPIPELWTGQLQQVHDGNAAMYDRPLSRIAPALLGVPWLILRLRRNPRDPLALLALALGVAVVYGGLAGQWSYGRFISHAVLVCQLGLADAAATLEQRLGSSRGAWPQRLLAPATAGFLLAASWPSVLRPTLEEMKPGDPHWLGFLGREVGRDDVVLAALEDCWYVPAFRGRIVAYPMPLPFVPDHQERVEAVDRFFARGATREERAETMRRYRVSFILALRRGVPEGRAAPDELRELGTLADANDDYELLRTRLPPPGPSTASPRTAGR